MDVKTLFQSFADDFMAGEHLAFAQSFTHPLIVYSPGEIRIEKTVEDTLSALSDRLTSARMAGATAATSTAIPENPSGSGRHPVVVRWTFLNDRNTPCGTSVTRYYIRAESGQPPRIELIEILESTIHAPVPHIYANARH